MAGIIITGENDGILSCYYYYGCDPEYFIYTDDTFIKKSITINPRHVKYNIPMEPFAVKNTYSNFSQWMEDRYDICDLDKFEFIHISELKKVINKYYIEELSNRRQKISTITNLLIDNSKTLENRDTVNGVMKVIGLNSDIYDYLIDYFITHHKV